MKYRVVLYGILLSLVISVGCAQTPKKVKAPNFTLKTLNGTTIDLAKLKGKVVLVNFWATWCGPCRAEIPDFIKVYDSIKSKGFEIVGIALDQEGWSVVQPYMKEKKINYPVVLGTEDVIQRYGGITGIPTTFLIDRKGYVVARQIGYLSKEALEQGLKSVLD